MIQTTSIPFAFGNLKEQFSLTAEPILSEFDRETLKQASIREEHEVISKILQPFIAPKQCSVTITHDVDWLDPYHPYAWIRSGRNLFTKQPRISFKQLCQHDLFLRNCERLLQTEQQNHIESVWCLGALPTEGLGRFDIRYSAHNPLLKELIALIQQYNQHIGLHSSYNALANGTFSSELEQLQQLTGKPVLFHRSHYLNAEPAALYAQLETSNIPFELGWGYPRTVAFKGGLPTMFKPINALAKKTFSVQVLPLLMMDNVFFIKPEREIFQQFSSILQSLKNINGNTCLLFHPENFLLKPQLWDSFQQIIDICTQHHIALHLPKP